MREVNAVDCSPESGDGTDRDVVQDVTRWVFVDIEAGAQPWEAGDGERSDGGELVLAGEDWLSCR